MTDYKMKIKCDDQVGRRRASNDRNHYLRKTQKKLRKPSLVMS